MLDKKSTNSKDMYVAEAISLLYGILDMGISASHYTLSWEFDWRNGAFLSKKRIRIEMLL